MGIQVSTTQEIADLAADTWLMPELQRPLVWKPAEVALLFDSLRAKLPIHQLEMWKLAIGERIAIRSVRAGAVAKGGAVLVIDGQQRATALALMMAKNLPDWCDPKSPQVTRVLQRVAYNVMTADFDVKAKRPKGSGWILARDLFLLDDEDLEQAVTAAMPPGEGPDKVRDAISRSRENRNAIRSRSVSVETTEMDLIQAATVFERHNSAGKRLSQEDILLASIAAYAPGLPTGMVRPFTESFGDELKPEALLKASVRSLITQQQYQAKVEVTSRMTGVDFAQFAPESWAESWKKVEAAWRSVLEYLSQYGVHRSTLPGLNPVIPLVLFHLRWGDGMFRDDRMAALYLLGLRSSRFAKHSTDAHMLDAATILKAPSAEWALWDLKEKILHDYKDDYNTSPDLTADELLTSSLKSSANRDLFYAVWAHRRHYRDWKTGLELTRTKGRTRKRSSAHDVEFHHVVPLAYVKNNCGTNGGTNGTVPAAFIDSFANMALLSATTNNELSDHAPAVALAKMNVDAVRLAEQMWEGAENITTMQQAEEVIRARAERMSAPGEMNWFITTLRDMPAPSPVTPAVVVPVPPGPATPSTEAAGSMVDAFEIDDDLVAVL
jgi:hypothetical protein